MKSSEPRKLRLALRAFCEEKDTKVELNNACPADKLFLNSEKEHSYEVNKAGGMYDKPEQEQNKCPDLICLSQAPFEVVRFLPVRGRLKEFCRSSRNIRLCLHDNPV